MIFECVVKNNSILPSPKLFDLAFNQSSKEIEENSEEGTTNNNHIENKSILLVEDNMINQQIAVANLEMLGFQVDVAENGKLSTNYKTPPSKVVIT